MNIVAFFTDNNVPKTGIVPTIDIWNLAGTQVVAGDSMTEVAGGFYYYNFVGYGENTDYCIRADGTAALANAERYVFTSNATSTSTQLDRLEVFLQAIFAERI